MFGVLFVRCFVLNSAMIRSPFGQRNQHVLQISVKIVLRIGVVVTTTDICRDARQLGSYWFRAAHKRCDCVCLLLCVCVPKINTDKFVQRHSRNQYSTSVVSKYPISTSKSSCEWEIRMKEWIKIANHSIGRVGHQIELIKCWSMLINGNRLQRNKRYANLVSLKNDSDCDIVCVCVCILCMINVTPIAVIRNRTCRTGNEYYILEKKKHTQGVGIWTGIQYIHRRKNNCDVLCLFVWGASCMFSVLFHEILRANIRCKWWFQYEYDFI